MGASRRSVLLVTPTDYDRMWNSIEHSRVRYYSDRGYNVTLLFKKMNTTGGVVDLFWDTVSFRMEGRRDGGVHQIAADPFFNYFAGLRTQSESQAPTDAFRRSWKQRLIRLFSPLGILRDMFFVPCMVLAAVAKGREGRYDVCLAIGPWGGIVGWILRFLGKVDHLIYEDRDYETGFIPDRLRRFYTSMLEKFCMRRADLVVSVGNRLAELRRRQTGRGVVMISNGVDWARFETARSATKRGQVIFYSGALLPWSGLDLVIPAMSKVIERHPGAQLVIVGDGVRSYRDGLEAAVGDLGLESTVTFMGSQPYAKLPELMAGATIGLANSQPVDYRQYACPLKVLEYMAAGMAVLATKDTEAADMVRQYQSGVAASFEIDSIAEAIIALLDDRDGCLHYQHNGIHHSENLQWEQLVGREEELIFGMLGVAVGVRSESSRSFGQ